jgi:hypothetical protein
MNCSWCDEDLLIDDGPIKVLSGGATGVHRECYIRMLMGSVGHQMKTCSCFGGKDEDPEGMTKHEAAHAAAILYFATRAAKPDEG